MAITTTQAQGLVLALFGASAGGHLTGLAAASNLNTLAGDLSTSAGLILGKDLSSNTAFRDHVTANLKLSGDALTAANAWLDGQLNAGAARGDIIATAVTFLSTLTDTTSPFYASAQAFQATVTAAVAWSTGAGATQFGVAALRAQQGNVEVVPGASFTLTITTDTVIGTAGNDTFTGAVTTYSDNDRVIDASSTDNDTYTLSVGGNAVVDASGVENVNVTTESTSGVTIDAAKLSGVKNLTVTPGNLIVGGSTIAGAKSVGVSKVNATAIEKITVGVGATAAVVIDQTAATASLSKTGVTVDAANATHDVTITGAVILNADNAAAVTGRKVIVQPVNGSSAAELAKPVTVNAAKAVDVEINNNTSVFTGSITVNAAAAREVNVASAAGGATINAALGATSTGNGIVVTGISSNGATITTGSYGSKSASGTISNEGKILLGGSATSATDDVATVSAAGFVALTTNQGNEQVETVNLSGNGAALEVALTGAATTYRLTGDKDITLKGNVSSFAGKTLSDNTTAGTTEVRITTLDTADLSKIAADRIVVASDVASKTLTVASGANVVLASDLTTAFAVAGKTADSTVSLSTADDTNNNGSTIDITTGTLTLNSNIATVNLDATVGRLTVGTATVLDNSNASGIGATLNITGNKAVALGTVTAKAIAGGSASGAITLTATGADTARSITTGTGNDQITLNQSLKFTVDAGNGDNTITVTSVAEATAVVTGSGTDTVTISDVDAIVVVTGSGDDTVNINADSDAVIVMGEGTGDTAVFGAAYDLTTTAGNSNFALTGVETIDITAANGTVKVRAAAFAQDNVFRLIGNSDTADIYHVVNTSSTAGATIDASGVTFASTQNAALILEGAAALADTITGSARVDRIIGTTGADVIDGGDGVDTYVAPAPGSNIEGTATGTSTGFVVNLGTSAVTNTAILAAIGKYTASSLTSVGAGTTAHVFDAASATGQAQSAIQQTIRNVENIDGGSGVDYLVGSANANVINGDAGADYIDGGAGNDTINGGNGADTILGGADDDIIDGGADADTINGGTGNDTITGGAGNDLITGGAGADTILFGNASGNDTVTLGTSGAATDGSADLVRFNFTTAASLAVTDNVKTINGFEAVLGTDVIQFAQGLLVTSGGTTATTTDSFQTFASGSFSNAASWTSVASDKVFFEVQGTSDVAAGSGTDAALVWAAIAGATTATVATDVVTVAKVMFAVSDGTDTFLWYFNSANVTAASTDITLVGILRGVNDVAAGDFSIV